MLSTLVSALPAGGSAGRLHVSGTARVTADGYTLILPLDMAVTRLLSTYGKLPPLTFGRPVTDTYAPRVTGERRRRNA